MFLRMTKSVLWEMVGMSSSIDSFDVLEKYHAQLSDPRAAYSELAVLG